MKIAYLSLCLIILQTITTTAHAQDVPALSGSKEPVEISAGKTLEWHQKDKQYIADGDVEVTQGDVTILADKLVADYRDDNKGGNVEIWQLTAQENVRIRNLNTTASSDKATYNVESGVAILTGGDLKLTTADQVITANERMEYDTIKGTARAVGNAKIVQKNDTLQANVIKAIFMKNDAGKQTLKTATASGNVIITTPSETLTGDNGFYNAQSNIAEIKGHVKILRGKNILEGDRAEVNLTTNVSKMFGNPDKGTRVKGVFFPGSTKK